MYETKAFWGKESNSNINTLNTTLNTLNSNNLLYVVVIITVLAIAVFLCMTTRAGFG